MNPIDTEVTRLLEEVRQTVWSEHETGGIGRAFLIAALVLAQDRNATTLYHYTAFYNIHHSLELLLKGVFDNSARGHNLMNLIAANPTTYSGFFTEEHLAILSQSDELNSDPGELRYFALPHLQFDWDLFVKLALLAKEILEQDTTRHGTTHGVPNNN